MLSLIDKLILEFDEKLGKKTFYSISELKSAGFFGSLGGARLALREGVLPTLKISRRRSVVPREAIIEFLKSQLNEKNPNVNV